MKLQDFLNRERQIATGSSGVAFDLGLTEEWARETNALGNCARAFLTTAIRCRLLGLEESSRELLTRSLRWVRMAIAEDERPERYAAGGTEAQRYQVLALARWLEAGIDEAEALSCFVHAEDKFLESSSLRRDPLEVSLVSPWYLYAGEHRRVLDLLNGSRRPPGPRSEAATVAALADAHLRGEVVSVAGIAEAMLRTAMPKWLSAGHQIRAALWMRLAYGADGNSAVDVTHRCLDYLLP